LRNRGVAARFPLSVSSFSGSMSGARAVVNSLAFRGSTGASGGVFTDGVSLHPVRTKRLRNSRSVRMVKAFREVTLKCLTRARAIVRPLLVKRPLRLCCSLSQVDLQF
jgi:hypothetical protein